MTGEDTAARVVKGAAWVVGTRWLVRLMGMVSVIVLARLLLPEDFGVVAVASTCIWILDGLSEFDVTKALIRSPALDQDLLDTAWTLTVARGVLSSTIMLLGAPIIAYLMDDPRLEAVISVLAISPLLYGLKNPKFISFERDLVFFQHSLVMIGQKLGGFVVSLVIAVVYQNYWALILGAITTALVNVTLSYVLIPYRPSLCLKRFRELFAFSGWMSLESALSTLSLNLDNFIIGYFIGVKETGIYYMSHAIAMLPTENLLHPINHVLFPSFSAVSSDYPQLRRIAIEAIGINMSIGLAVCVGFALVADGFVPLVLGDQWLSIIPYLQIIVPVLGLQVIFATIEPVVMAVGNTRALFVNAMIYSTIRLPAFFTALMIWGLDGAVWSLAFSCFFYCLLLYRLMYVTLDLRPMELWREAMRPVTAVLAMLLAVTLLQHLIGDLPLMQQFPTLLMLCKIGVGGPVYCAVHYGAWLLLDKPTGIEQRLWQIFRRYYGGYSVP